MRLGRYRGTLYGAVATALVGTASSPTGVDARKSFPVACGRNSYDVEPVLTFRLKLRPRRTNPRVYTYFYNIQARRAFKGNIADTMGRLTYRAPGQRRASTHPVDARRRDKGRLVKRPYYYHGTVRVVARTKLSYFFRMSLHRPIPVPGGRIVAFRYHGSCRAAVR